MNQIRNEEECNFYTKNKNLCVSSYTVKTYKSDRGGLRYHFLFNFFFGIPRS